LMQRFSGGTFLWLTNFPPAISFRAHFSTPHYTTEDRP
jgi:hypothetical protein